MNRLCRRGMISHPGLWLSLLALCSQTAVSSSTNSSTTRLPIELHDIGYDGTWEQFCDPKLIKQDFPLYHTHELKSLRKLLCAMKDRNAIGFDRESQIALAAYKYCEMMRSCADDFLIKLIDGFSLNDEQKRSELVAPGPFINSTECFKKAKVAFNRTCVDEENPFFRMYSPLLARACTVRWLTTTDILARIDNVCAGKRLTSIIDWNTIYFSIPFRGERT